MIKRIILIILIAAFIPFGVFAQEKDEPAEEVTEKAVQEVGEKAVSYGGEVDFVSQYVWRGLAWTDGPVMQPSAWVSAYGFEFTVWSNFVLNDEVNQGEFNEVDLILNYSYEWKKLKIEPHFEYWFYPNQADSPSTGELSLKLSYPIYKSLSAFTYHTFDIKEYRKSYFGEIGLSYEMEFLEKIFVESGLSFAWADSKFNETYVGVAKNALNALNFRAAVAYYPWDFFYLKPHMEVSTLLDNELAGLVNDRTLISGGLIIGVEF